MQKKGSPRLPFSVYQRSFAAAKNQDPPSQGLPSCMGPRECRCARWPTFLGMPGKMLYFDGSVRRFLAILLSTLFLLPLLPPLLAQASGSGGELPVCCRREGAHHCAMTAAERSALHRAEESDLEESDQSPRQLRAPLSICPFLQHLPAIASHEHAAPGRAAVLSAGLLHEPSPAARAACLRRISFDRSRQKRGPPSRPVLRLL